MGWYEMGCLRRVMDVTRRDHIKNVDIRANLDITEDIVERIQARRLRYFGHVVRTDQHLLLNLALNNRVEGNRVKVDPGSAGWIMLLTTAIIVAGASWRLHT